ncbi:MAG: hypothetical protein FJ301_04215 [Planctomycetes bacterium]|nr:hypothetical protein [Planctomycetota bacterium]
MSRVAFAVYAALALAACAPFEVPPAEATLREERGDRALETRTRAAITAADAAPADPKAALVASRWLFFAADWRMQRAICEWLRAHPAAARADVLAADERVPDGVRKEVASLCQRGLEFADRAAAKLPGDVDARLHQALHTSLLAWSQGAAKALVAGYGRTIGNAVDAAVAIDPLFDGAAPLRLAGRFRSQAPWPYGDKPAAERALRRAVQATPNLVNCLFYGDALAASERFAEAEIEWRAAVGARSDAGTQWTGEFLREQARRRLGAPQ